VNTEGDPRSIVITGTSSGIGHACALRLDRAGLRVFAGVRQEADAEALRRQASDRLTPLFLDVTLSASIAAARQAVEAAIRPGGLHGLVNNAGIPLGGPLEFLSLDDMRQQFEVNFFGAIAVTQSFLPLLRHGRGRIVNISSSNGLLALPFLGPYAASKFALEAVSDSWRVELKPWGIAVALVEPGAVATPVWEKGVVRARHATEAMPPRAHELYGPVFGMLAGIQGHGLPPDEVARRVEHALLAPRPRARYPVGRNARLFALLRRLPVRLRDWFLARRLPTYP
jgi:NAD(P)-dependent dehydrogenase (short-subunit alcohol dehydrogenase family)